MGEFNMHAIKRKARKEAWYGDGSAYNPFRKTTRSSTWSNPQREQIDVEAGDGEPINQLTQARTEPIPESPRSALTNDGRKEEEEEMTRADPTLSNGRASNPNTENTMVERQISHTSGHAPRSGLVSRFRRKGKETGPRDREGDGEGKKRPWYKGKVLKHKPFTLRNQLGATLFNSWINIMLVAVPVGIALNYAGVDGKVIFVVNFLAIIPLAAMLSFATEEIALHVGESLGGLLNASFGNAVEMIVAILALVKDEYTVVQTSLIGSVLSNLLLVLGMCFFLGGLRRQEQFFNKTVAQTATALLALAVGSVIIPTCFDQFSETPLYKISQISRGVSIILLLVYAAYLYFQLSTHSDLFNQVSEKVPVKPRKGALPEGGIAKGLVKAGGIGAGPGRANMSDRPPHDELMQADAFENEEEEEEEPQLHIAVAWATLAISTAFVGLCAEFMVDGISSITEDGSLSVEFVGLILLPIVGNAAEHATAVTVAIKDKMDLAIGVAIGSSMQVALFLIPLLNVLGWILSKDCMNLSFDGFQVIVLFVAVLLVNYLIADGASNWIEGFQLMALYIIIAVCAFFYPNGGQECPGAPAPPVR